MSRGDAEIQQAVLRELSWDTRVEETDVGVQVSDGVVTLVGTVGSWGERTAAQEAAHRVAGVLDVANDIRVVVPSAQSKSDTELARAVRRTLEWDVLVPDTRIRSTISDGKVILEGDVDYWSQREDAERAVRNLSGVCGVVNKIEIKPRVASCDVQKAIEDALERRAQREAGRIELQVHDGRVIISGPVLSWQERQTVIGAVKGTPGVQFVEDRLRIEPQPA